MVKEWFNRARIYHIFVDRFAGCNEELAAEPVFAGGNLKAIIPHLQYISNLGITALWLSPFYKGVSYHGYHITDFFDVDEHFGTIDDVRILINECHNIGIRVVIDFVPNHCSKYHPYFKEALADKKSEFYSWFTFDSYPTKYQSFLDFDELPKLNLRNKATAEHLLRSAEYWLSMGIDGFRIDHVLGVPRSFLKKLKKRVAAINPDAVLFGEVWTEGLQPHHFRLIDIKNRWWHKRFGLSQHTAQRNYIGILDGVLDFESRAILLKEIAHAASFSFADVSKKLQLHLSRYPKTFKLVQFLDNHDTNRFMFECGNEVIKLHSALDLLALTNEPVVIYYGTELALSQSEALSWAKPHADLAVRMPMPWNSIDSVMISETALLLRKK